MFIRRTKTSSSARGPHYTFRLVKTARVNGRVKQQTLLNLGAQFDLDPALWADLTSCLEHKLSAQSQLMDSATPPQVLQWAERLIARLSVQVDVPSSLSDSRSTSDSDSTSDCGPDGTGPWMERVDLYSGQDEQVRTVGLERLALHSIEQLELSVCLTELGLKPSYQRLALALIGARMIHPTSERATHHWLDQVSALPELLQFHPSDLKLERLYRVGDALYAHRSALESHLSARCAALLGGDETLVFYDLTNTWFTTTKEKSRLCRFGRGKQRGTTAPVVTLGLSLNGQGFPIHSEILPGNVSEPGTLEEAIKRLENHRAVPSDRDQTVGTADTTGNVSVNDPLPPRPTVVMDAGICTEANGQWLTDQGYDYITIARTRLPYPEEEPDATVVNAQQQTVSVWRQGAKNKGGGEEGEESGQEKEKGETYLVVHSPAREAKEEAMIEKHKAQWEQELDRLKAGLSLPRRMKKVDKIHQKIGRLKQQYRRVHGLYDLEVKTDDPVDPQRVTDITWRLNEKATEAAAKHGCYLLRSSRQDLGEEALVRLYWQLTDIESTFRSLKSELGMRPIYHQKDSRVAAHIWLSVLAYYCVHSLRLQLKAKGWHESWRIIRERIGHRIRLTTRYRNDQQQWVGYRRDTPPSAQEREILGRLSIPVQVYRRKLRPCKG